MTTTQPTGPTDTVLHAVADLFERQEAWRTRRALRNGAGPEVYSLVYEAARQVYGLPAIRHIEQHLRVGQLQHWRETGLAKVVAALRSAAGEPPAEDLEAQTLRAQLTALHAALLDATGYGVQYSPEVLIREAGDELTRLRREVEALSLPLRLLDDAALTRLQDEVQAEIGRRTARQGDA